MNRASANVFIWMFAGFIVLAVAQMVLGLLTSVADMWIISRADALLITLISAIGIILANVFIKLQDILEQLQKR